ncbi:MAG TPA: hypothetical protein VEH31_37170 [Streptosporangiaceae bacterium]|nr:hypothetical protein [Streptosporangiaceae bacterium]
MTIGTPAAAGPMRRPAHQLAFQIFRPAACRAGCGERGGVTHDDAVPTTPLLFIAIACRPLPTGSAAPDTRLTISLAATLVARVMIMSTRGMPGGLPRPVDLN